ncbi:MAG: hypothetical protein RIT14_437 [Pseudomonadota bacterium]|jgi:2-methylcitrate dehydratase PrpD
MSLLSRILDLALMPERDLPAEARVSARFSLFDWMVCGRAGVAEPLAVILRRMVEAEGGRALATVIGGGAVPARAAALVNGATSHALDYDDTHFAHVGHPSVAICPAALAAGEEMDAGAAAVADAFLVGAEVSVRVGLALGAVHYNRGFHQTATAGAFGATVAAGRIYGLTQEQMRVAIGLCATRASGLKSQFGTMGKPYNAGIAAANGVECAALARAGFTSADDGLEGAQGFIPTHSDAPNGAAVWDAAGDRFLFRDVKYKLHACCHGTHAMIEALSVCAGDVALAEVAEVRLRTSPRWLSVCDIKAPRTGLEVKFSYAWLAGMVMSGISTASDRIYTDALARDARLADFAARVVVTGDLSVGDMQARGEVVLTDGRVLPFFHDLDAPIADAMLAESLRQKARGLLGDEAERLWHLVDGLYMHSARDLGRALRGGA